MSNEKLYTEVWDSVNTDARNRKGKLTSENVFRFAEALVERCAVVADEMYLPDTARRIRDLKTATPPQEDWDEKRMDVIGSNGPTGDHYENV